MGLLDFKGRRVMGWRSSMLGESSFPGPTGYIICFV